MKQKMDIMTKAKLIYSVELGIFVLVFLVLAILKFVGVIGTNAVRLTVFNWITLFGGTWLVVDFFWALLDKKRQKRVALIDKCIHLPAGLYLIAFDLYCLIAKPDITSPICRYAIPIVFTYLGLCYAFEAIYHFKYPVPGIFDALEEDKKPIEQEQQVLEEKQEDSSKEESEAINHDEKE